MKKNKSRKIMLAALVTSALTLGHAVFGDMAPKQPFYAPDIVFAAQVPDAGDSRLSEFDIAPGDLSPAFTPDVTEYTSTIGADVTSVVVRAIPRSSVGTIASVEGAKSLKPGLNTIKVICSAQDNTYTTYTITVTVGSADAGKKPETEQGNNVNTNTGAQPDAASKPNAGDTQQGNSTPNTGGQNADGTQSTGGAQAQNSGNGSGTGQDSKKQDPSALTGEIQADGTVALGGAAYRLSNNFSYASITQDIPSAFKQGTVKISGVDYATLFCGSNGVNLVYLENTDGSGSTGFYYYDEKQNTIERFKYAKGGDSFVIFINAARKDVPDGYEAAVLELPSGKAAAAYRNTASGEMADYYLVYGIYSDGSDGWYLYDHVQGTYMRYIQAAGLAQKPADEPQEEQVQERTVSMEKYNLLYEKYTSLRNNFVRLVSAFAISVVVLLIIFTALLMRAKDKSEDENETGQERRRVRKRAKKPQEPVSKSSLAAGRSMESGAAKGEAKKITRTITKEPAREEASEAPYRREPGVHPDEIHEQMQREQAVRAIKEQAAVAQEATWSAAENMRRSVQRKDRKPAAPYPHDPMDDWEVDDAPPARKSRANKKKYSLIDEDVEIMDLNDL